MYNCRQYCVVPVSVVLRWAGISGSLKLQSTAASIHLLLPSSPPLSPLLPLPSSPSFPPLFSPPSFPPTPLPTPPFIHYPALPLHGSAWVDQSCKILMQCHKN